jgi:hypothetical protein
MKTNQLLTWPPQRGEPDKLNLIIGGSWAQSEMTVRVRGFCWPKCAAESSDNLHGLSSDPSRAFPRLQYDHHEGSDSARIILDNWAHDPRPASLDALAWHVRKSRAALPVRITMMAILAAAVAQMGDD